MQLRLRAKQAISVILVALMMFTPFSPLMVVKPLAPVVAAQAKAVDDIKSCMNVVGAVAGAAAGIGEALADPTYTACIGQAAAGDVLAIGMMAAVTALWVIGGMDDFKDPAECNGFIMNKLLGAVASGITAALGMAGGLLETLLTGLLGSAAVDKIKELAAAFGADEAAAGAEQQVIDAAKQKVTDLVNELTPMLGPLGGYLKCGCAAAGTAAIIKNAGSAIADSGASCWALLKNPGALLEALLDDPGAVFAAGLEAACGALESVGMDYCGAAKAIYGFFKDLCEASGVCTVGGAIVGWVGDAAEWLNCNLNPFSDCDPPPPPTPPPPCPVGLYGQNDGCICDAPKGRTNFNEHVWTETCVPTGDGINKVCDVSNVQTCAACGKHEGIDQFGYCQKCPLGMQNDPATGKCAVYACPAGQLYRPDGLGCFACPAGTKSVSDSLGNGCVADCGATPWLSFNPDQTSSAAASAMSKAGLPTSMLRPGACTCPPGQNEFGFSCVTPPSCDADKGLWLNTKTNQCEQDCPDGETKVRQGEFNVCKKCPDGQISKDGKCESCVFGKEYARDNVCIAMCDSDDIRFNGSCTACPEGTQAGSSKDGHGENNSCVPTCPAGYEYSSEKANAYKAVSANSVGQLSQSVQGMIGNSGVNSKVIVGAQPGAAAGGGGGSSGGFLKGGNNQSSGPHIPVACVPCGENEYLSTKSTTYLGVTFTFSQCEKCVAGETSKPGSSECTPFKVDISLAPAGVGVPTAPQGGLQRAPEHGRPDNPPRRIENFMPPKVGGDPQRAIVCPPGRVANRSGSACVIDDAARSNERPSRVVSCPPGRVPNRAGTGCTIDLDDSGGGSGGGTARGGSAGGRANAPGGGSAAPSYIPPPVTAPRGGNSKPF